jgi:2-octaprenyl-6-methoxyphenol hydroxylase|tara:strand:- start:1154 stop:2419 length:1266 start_codon:yes stop_codon:yes gene_type:complete
VASNDYDIIISGGGLVGASLAIALADLPLRIALVEAVLPDDAENSSFDERSIALSRSSKSILNALDLWPDIDTAAWPIDEIHVSEKGRFGSAVINADEQGIDHLGHVIKSRILGGSLWHRLSECSAIDVFCPARVGSVAVTSTGVAVDVEQDVPVSISCTLLVVADGARSAAREQLGVAAQHKSYGQSAIIGNVSIDLCHAGNVAYERFTSAGPLALLPGADGVYTFVLTRNTDDVDATLALSDDAMRGLLQELFGYRVGVFRNLGRRFAYPLYLSTAESLTAERTIIVGNAAHGLHPVAGQGFNLGLRDAAALAELIANAIASVAAGVSPADQLNAELEGIQSAYCEWRQADQRNVVSFTDGLIELFGKPGGAVSIARGLSLLGFDLLPAAKRGLARYAMGQGGRLTRLARGIRTSGSES